MPLCSWPRRGRVAQTWALCRGALTWTRPQARCPFPCPWAFSHAPWTIKHASSFKHLEWFLKAGLMHSRLPPGFVCLKNHFPKKKQNLMYQDKHFIDKLGSVLLNNAVFRGTCFCSVRRFWKLVAYLASHQPHWGQYKESLVETVVQKSINPIDKVERSALIMAATVHEKPASELVNDGHCVPKRVNRDQPYAKVAEPIWNLVCMAKGYDEYLVATNCYEG